jgi:preprotein translocase YajC subunit
MTAASFQLVIAAASKTPAKGSPYITFIMIAGLGAFWYFFLRPRRKAMREQQAAAKTFGLGDEIMTIGGVIGVVVDVDGDRFTIRTGGTTGSELVFTKQAFKSMAPAQKVDTPAVEPAGDADATGDEQ